VAEKLPNISTLVWTDTMTIFVTPDIRDARTISFEVRTHSPRAEFTQQYQQMGVLGLTFKRLDEVSDQHDGYAIIVAHESGSDHRVLKAAFGAILENVHDTRQQHEAQLRNVDFRRARGDLLPQAEVLELPIAGEEVGDDLTGADGVAL
jgi:hypothetical protein